MRTPTARLHLETGYRLDGQGRIVGTQEPAAVRQAGPLFTIVRSREEVVWAASAALPEELAGKLEALASGEDPFQEPQEEPRCADALRTMLPQAAVVSGPCFHWREVPQAVAGVSFIDDAELMQQHFEGWVQAEMAGRAPLAAVLRAGAAVSVCGCARKTHEAAEASLATGEDWRGQAYAGLVTSAWARAVWEEGLVPLYSTQWGNMASRRVAAKLGLRLYAVSWSLLER